MKFYSEKLDKIFDTEKECIEAENAKLNEKEELTNKIIEVYKAYKDSKGATGEAFSFYQEKVSEQNKLWCEYWELKEKYLKDYGYFSLSAAKDENGETNVTISDKYEEPKHNIAFDWLTDFIEG